MRFCLVDGHTAATAKRVHYAANDEVSMTFCGQFASREQRFSRRMVVQLMKNGQPLPLCKNCLAAHGED